MACSSCAKKREEYEARRVAAMAAATAAIKAASKSATANDPTLSIAEKKKIAEAKFLKNSLQPKY